MTCARACTQDALRQLVLYVNGVPHFGEGTQIWHNMLTMGGGTCSVGCHPAAGADGLPGQAFFDGNIDELRIYNGALNLAAIRNDYQHLWCSHSPPPPPPGSALLLFYPFDEAEGRWVGDYSEVRNLPLTKQQDHHFSSYGVHVTA